MLARTLLLISLIPALQRLEQTRILAEKVLVFKFIENYGRIWGVGKGKSLVFLPDDVILFLDEAIGVLR